ncbi:hypothetical protein KFE25_013136 [Diacronema lutheri]|uniref:OTU domain-containing protein n=1 Tax=Diacronema lutheri TaxID=2081491 RepID=A0A8J5X818_DIALT|nr:hypothetical protein KFE25_013136 [Diacronema lutheri]
MLNQAALARARAAREGRGAPPIDAAVASRAACALESQFAVRRSEITPRLNPPAEQLAATPRTQDRARLVERLAQFGLQERQVTDDASCQFRAISDQLYGTEEHHDLVRAMAVEQLLTAPEQYVEFVLGRGDTTSYDDYVQRMSLADQLGDHVTLQALADYLGIELFLVSSSEDDGLQRVAPAAVAPEGLVDFGHAPLWLTTWANVHYKSVAM